MRTPQWLMILAAACGCCHLGRGDVLLTQDVTYADRWNPVTNYGATTAVLLTANAVNTMYGYLRWDISGVSSGYTVTDAVVRVRKAYSFNNGTATMKLFAVTGDWTENAVTWSNQPAADTATALASTAYYDSDAATTAYSFSGPALTALVQNWVNGAAANQGLELRQTGWTGTLALHSDDAATAGLRPALVVSWNGQPQTFIAGEASHISKYFATTNYGGATHLDLSDNGSVNLRGLLRWDLGQIPAGSTLDSVTVKLYRAYGFRNTSTQLKLLQPDAAWVEGNGGTDDSPAGELVWNNQPGLVSTTAVASTTAYDSDPAGTTYEFRSTGLNALVQGWIDGSIPNTGLRLTQAATGVFAVRSDDYATLSQRPELEVSPISFTLAAPSGCSLTVDTQQAAAPVNRRVLGVGLLSPPFADAAYIAAYTGVFDGVGGRVWAHTESESYWNGLWPFVTGVGLGEVNALCSNGVLPSQAWYVSASSNNLTVGQQPTAYAQLAGRLINDRGFGIDGWEVWNEPEVPQNGAWPSADFARYIADCAQALRVAVSGLRIGAPLYEGDQNWNIAFLSAIAAQPVERRIDFAVTHPYDFYWQQAQKNLGSYYARVSGAEPLRLYSIRPKVQLLQQTLPGCGLAASEWNVHPVNYDPPYNVSTDIAVAIHVAAMFGVFWEENVESAQFFQFRNSTTGHFAMSVGTPDNLLPTGHVFNLYGKYFRGDRLNVNLTTPSYTYRHPYMTSPPAIPVLVAHACYDAASQRLFVVLVNRHRDAEASVPVQLQHFLASTDQATLQTITASDPESTTAIVTTDDSYAIPTQADPSITLVLPPHSITGLILSGVRTP